MITLRQAQEAISSKVVEILAPDTAVIVVLQGTDTPFELSNSQDAIVRITVNFGKTIDGERGKDGASRRIGVLTLSIYTLWGEGAVRGLEIANTLESAFRRIDLPAGTEGFDILFDDPYTEGGVLTDATKFCYTTHAPFFVWVNE